MISVKNNQFTYSNIDGIQGSFPHVDGPNKFGTPLSHVQTTHTGTYTGTSPTIKLATIDNTSNYIRYNITGTITKNVEDGIQYYQITSVGPVNDPTIIIPANPYSNVDNVNVSLWQHKSQKNHFLFHVVIIPVGAENPTYTINFVTDAYCY